MISTMIEKQTSSISNPFDNYTSNGLSNERLVEYWCDPFTDKNNAKFSLNNFTTDNTSIFIKGSRGSGKTTLLRYFSFEVQKYIAEKKNIPIINMIHNNQFIGFYYRCDDSLIKLFKNVFEKEFPDRWISLFEYQIELFLCKNILDSLLTTYSQENEIFKKILCTINSINNESFLTINEVLQNIVEEINYLAKYQNNYGFIKQDFTAKRILRYLELSKVIINSWKEGDPTIKETKFLFLIDEFENLSEELQIFFNNKVKFAQEPIYLRIGYRSENAVTKETINREEFLRENHDYSLYDLDKNPENVIDRTQYLYEVAQKRLKSSSYSYFRQLDIKEILSESENLEGEARKIVQGKKKHISIILNNNEYLQKNEKIIEDIQERIINDDNPIAESFLALKISREKLTDKNLLLKKVSQYKKDYEDKKQDIMKAYSHYKVAIIFLLASIYKRQKQYYSFKTLVYLSEGNTRTFINLCKYIFTDSLFYEKDRLLNNGKISEETQTRAIRNFSNDELRISCSIIKYGKQIGTLIRNIGNIFSEYHKDSYLRYPITNQFVLESALEENKDEIFNIALGWSLIRKSNKIKRLYRNEHDKGYVYSLNRIFVPNFDISYISHGGKYVKISELDLTKMEKDDFSVKSFISVNDKNQPSELQGELNFGDTEDEYDI